MYIPHGGGRSGLGFRVCFTTWPSVSTRYLLRIEGICRTLWGRNPFHHPYLLVSRAYNALDGLCDW